MAQDPSNSILILGYSAAAITSLASIPQVYQVYTTRKADDLSYTFLFSLYTGMFMWMVYGILLSNIPVVVSNVVALILYGSIAILKCYFRIQEKKIYTDESNLINNKRDLELGESTKLIN